MGKDSKITIIGMGFLMGYLRPCYEAMFGDNMATHINAVTADEENLEKKRAEFPFEITLNDNLAALRKMKPDMIFFAPPPKLAPSIAEDVLVTYYKECRDAGEKIPDLYAFPPAPKGKYYRDLLGKDLNVCNILPNMIREAGGKVFGPEEGVTFITFPDDDDGAWTKDSEARLFEFFGPLGNIVLLKTADVMNVLASTCLMLTSALLMNTISEGLKEGGIDVSFNKISEAMRVYHQMQYNFYPADTTVANTNVVSWELYNAIAKVHDSWVGGFSDFLIDSGIDRDKVREIVGPALDVYLHSYMRKTWAETEAGLRGQATKGGVGERAEFCYDLLAERHVKKAFAEFPEKGLSEQFLVTLRNIAYEITQIVALHGDRLAKESATPTTATHHAILYGLIFRHAADMLGDKGREAVNKATQHYGHQRGGRMAKRALANGDDLSMRTYKAYNEWTPDPGTMFFNTPEKSPIQIVHVLKCPWNTAWENFGFLDEAVFYCSYVDEALVYGFNPELKLQIDYFHSDTIHPYCRFVWHGFEETPENAQWLADKGKKLGKSVLRDWTYHTQHLLSAYNEKLTELLPEEGPQIIAGAMHDFEILFGVKMAELVRENQDVDYWTP